MSALPEGTKKEPALKEILELLEPATTLRVMSDWLEKKGMPRSAGSWKQLREDRIGPALTNGKITTGDLLSLLSDVEEYGGCHVFLYQCDPKVAAGLLDEQRIHSVAGKLELTHLLTDPAVTVLPEKPTIVDIRHGREQGGSLGVKVVETRVYEELEAEVSQGNKRVLTYVTKKARAVNVVRLSSVGILEVRIRSHSSAVDYDGDIKRIWGKLAEFFPTASFQPLPLAKLKTRLWEDRDTLKDLLRFSDAKMKDNLGFLVSAATPKKQSDLATNDGAVAAIHSFLASGAHQESSNVWWKVQEGGVPSTDIHVLLSGKANEFTMTASCTKADYEYVLAQFTRLGL
jgi:hypothetical protein